MILTNSTPTRDRRCAPSIGCPIYPRLFLTNLRSLLGKFDELYVHVLSMKPDIVCITESWLDDTVDSSSINIANYNVVRHDRLQRKGGGVLFYIKDTLQFELLNIDTLFTKEIEIVGIDYTASALLIIGVYIPPNLSQYSLNGIRDSICLVVDDFLVRNPGYNVIIMGDLNRFKCEVLCDDLVLCDIVVKPTRNKNILDHILVSEAIYQHYDKNVAFYAPIGNSDHLTIVVNPSEQQPEANENPRTVTVYDFRKSNLSLLCDYLVSVDWDNFFAAISDVDQQCTAFNNFLSILIDQCIPKRDVVMTNGDKDWLTPLTKSLIDQRWEAYRRKEWDKYNSLKVKVKAEILKSKQLFLSRLKSDKHRVWQLLDQLSGRKSKQKWNKEIQKSNGEGNLANLFADELSRIFTNELHVTNRLQDDPSNADNSDWDVSITESMVYQHLKRLSVKKSSGSDVIPTRIYVELADYLAYPLQIIYTNSVKQQKLPSIWKHAVVTPIPKTTPVNIKKFRPISVLPTQAKVFEQIILRTMRKTFEDNYGTSQHGFRECHSTTTALIETYESVSKAYDDVTTAGAAIASFDLSAAFDSIDHELLLKKFSCLGFPRCFVTWLQDYLHGRTCDVVVDGRHSRTISVSRGVPQGSVLGPFIFSVFISDLRPVFQKNTNISYADDTNIVMPLWKSSSGEVHTSIAQEIINMESWCLRNMLSLNKAKSKVLICLKGNEECLDGRPIIEIPQTKVLKILGVTFNSQLTWTDHVNDTLSKCNRRFYILRKAKPFVTLRELRQLYNATIRSLIEYACPVFVQLPRSLQLKLERIQKRACRLIDDAGEVECETLEVRRAKLSKRLFIKLLGDRNHILYKYLPKRLRYSGHFLVNRHRLLVRRNSFFPHVAKLINSDISKGNLKL